jgi:hypothetical protein
MSEEMPIGWAVTSTMQRPFADGVKQPVERKQFNTRDEALRYQHHMKECGWLANVTPVYLSPQRRGKLRAKAQMAPFGDFRQDWKIGR